MDDLLDGYKAILAKSKISGKFEHKVEKDIIIVKNTKIIQADKKCQEEQKVVRDLYNALSPNIIDKYYEASRQYIQCIKNTKISEVKL